MIARQSDTAGGPSPTMEVVAAFFARFLPPTFLLISTSAKLVVIIEEAGVAILVTINFTYSVDVD